MIGSPIGLTDDRYRQHGKALSGSAWRQPSGLGCVARSGRGHPKRRGRHGQTSKGLIPLGGDRTGVVRPGGWLCRHISLPRRKLRGGALAWRFPP